MQLWVQAGWREFTTVHLEKPGSTVRIRFFYFSSAFNTRQSVCLRDKLKHSGVDHNPGSWILDCLTNQPQYVRACDCESEMVVCSMGPCKEQCWLPFAAPSALRLFTSLPSVNCKSSDVSAVISHITVCERADIP